LLTCAVNHHRNHLRNQSALKRHAGTTPLRDDDLPADAAEEGPVYAFDREWAATVVDNALQNLRAAFHQAGKAAEFEVMRAFLPGAALSLSRREAARALGTGGPALKVAVHRMRARFKELLEREVGRTVCDPADIGDEMRHLLRVLAGS